MSFSRRKNKEQLKVFRVQGLVRLVLWAVPYFRMHTLPFPPERAPIGQHSLSVTKFGH